MKCGAIFTDCVMVPYFFEDDDSAYGTFTSNRYVPFPPNLIDG